MRLVGIAVAATLLLTGCSFPDAFNFTSDDFKDRVGIDTNTESEPTLLDPQETEKKSTKVKDTRKKSDLETGSTTHKISVGGMQVVIDYWMDVEAKKWDGRSELVHMTMHVERPDADTGIKITRFKVWTTKGDLMLEDIGEFMVQPPFSYATSVETPYSESGRIDMKVQVDLLVETEEDSGEFFRRPSWTA